MDEFTDGNNTARKRNRPRQRNRVEYALREFLFLPLLILAVWIALAIVAIVLDRNKGMWGQAVCQGLTMVVPPEISTVVLSTITPGLITIISIIFFVLLMAVQHESSSYTPVVLDQFLRRRSNRLFFGTFVGLTVYCLMTLALVPPNEAVLASTLALVLGVVTFTLLLVFVYTTVDQMRPSSAVWTIQGIALRSRAAQQPLLARCRREPHLPDAPATRVTADLIGYVVHIDDGVLARALRRVDGPVEIEFRIAMGSHLVPGSVIAEVRGADPGQRHQLADAVLDAVLLGRMRDLGHDTAYAVDHLGSMAWSAAAASGDPQGAQVAVATLHGLLVRLRVSESFSAESFGGPLPVVYNDRLLGKILDALTSVIAACGSSGQHQTCSNAIMTLADVLPVLDSEHRNIAVDRLQRVLPTARNQLFTSEMEQAFERMRQAMQEARLYESAQRIAQIVEQLHRSHRLGDPEEE
ncbi:putative membrane protein [Halopolyspora algeriensis]|uniref:Putative membrane protein n=1 Tax=Halopolyspora algeriensis TaxID=1500506 RepID=A0A368VZ89_9ACTN|nr:DUF2254 family protein [Halopolyspora algeriensis]RCW46152.1 putative membrane protein [Halopolyspora algeriensis]TQM55555.1 putative membrane protein [Halopolyspora algeriensis]